MARCGCSSSQCNCVIQSGPGTTVTGSGTAADPYIVSSNGGKLTTNDTPTVDHTLTGTGTTADPYVLESDVKLSADPNNALNIVGDGLSLTCADIAACTPPAGNIETGCGITGAGSVADPIRIQGLEAWPFACPETNGTRVYCGTDGSLLTEPGNTCQTSQVGLGTNIPFSGFCTAIATDGTRHRFSTQPNRMQVNNPDLCRPMLLDVRASAVIFIDGDGNDGTDGTSSDGNWVNQILCGIMINGATGPVHQQVGISGRGRLDYRIDAVMITIPPGGSVTLGSFFDGQSDNACHVDGASVQHPNIFAIGRTCG